MDERKDFCGIDFCVKPRGKWAKYGIELEKRIPELMELCERGYSYDWRDRLSAKKIQACKEAVKELGYSFGLWNYDTEKKDKFSLVVGFSDLLPEQSGYLHPFAATGISNPKDCVQLAADFQAIGLNPTIRYMDKFLSAEDLASLYQKDLLGVNIDYSYLDYDDNLCSLTENEIRYFEDTVVTIKEALLVDIDIYTCNHYREYRGSKGKEALGMFHTSDPIIPKKDCFITIDNFFIHECYKEKFHGAFNLNFQSLEEVICHEIAHSEKFRHCKAHTRITNELYKKVQDYQRQKQEDKESSIDKLIIEANRRVQKGDNNEKNRKHMLEK